MQQRKIRSYDKNGYVNKRLTSIFVNQMRKFLVRNAQVLRITLKTGVEIFNF